MPHANVWIKKKNWAKWQAIIGKSELINNLIESLHISEDEMRAAVDKLKAKEQNNG